MKIVTMIARLLLGLAFLVFGLNKFLGFIPTPPMPAGAAGQFFEVMMSTHYIQVVGFFEVVSALLLLFNRFVPLGLTLLGPVLTPPSQKKSTDMLTKQQLIIRVRNYECE